MLNKKQKIQLLDVAIEQCEKNLLYPLCLRIGWLAGEMFNIPNATKSLEISCNITFKIFPQLIEFKPKNIPKSNKWWNYDADGQTKRLEVLRKLKEQLTEKK